MGLRPWPRLHSTQSRPTSPVPLPHGRSEQRQYPRYRGIRPSSSKVMHHTKAVISRQAKRLATKADEHEQLIMKVTYSLGVLAFGIFCFMLGARPHDIPLLYAAFFVAAVPVRWVYYRAKKWHYFLLDFCYYANLICTSYLLFFSKNEKLFLLCFAFSEGPLAWALIVWRCSLVFSSLDKIVSVLIHLLPGTVFFIIRWWDPITFTQHPVEDGTFGPWPAWPLVESSATLWVWMFAVPLGVYVVWQLLYVAVVYGLRKQRILNDPEVQTSFRELARKASRANNIWWRLSGALGDDKRFLMYALIQGVFTVITMALTVPMFLSYQFHAAFQLFKISASIWNGGIFFFDVMPRQLHAKAAAKRELKAQQQSSGVQDHMAIERRPDSGDERALMHSVVKAGLKEVLRGQELVCAQDTGPLTRAATLGQANQPAEKESLTVSSLALEGRFIREDDGRPCRTCGRCGSHRVPPSADDPEYFLPAISDQLWMESMSNWEEESLEEKVDSGLLRNGGQLQLQGAGLAGGLDIERSIWQGAGSHVACVR